MSSRRTAAYDPVHRPCNPTQVWELEAKMQQWEFAFVSANGRKPSFMERREDATQVRRATELIELRQRSASLHRVLSAVNSYTIRDGLLEAKQPAVLAALALFLSVDVNHDGRVAEYELEPCASMPLPRASWWPSEHPSCHPVCIQAAHLCSRRLSVKTSSLCIHAATPCIPGDGEGVRAPCVVRTAAAAG